MPDYGQKLIFHAVQPANSDGSIQSIPDITGYSPETYQLDIQQLLSQLNQCSNELDGKDYGIQANNLLQCIKGCDTRFLDEQGFSLNAQILFTRHGECSIRGDKRLGLNPNSAVSNAAMENMGNTKAYTKGMWLDPNSVPRIAISPVLRAKQTASMVIPEGTNADLSIEAALAENSNAPSGTNIVSLEDFRKQTQHIPFWKSPIRNLLFKVSSWVYGTAGVFDTIQNKLLSADKILKKYQQNSDSTLNSSSITTLEDDKKIEATQSMIANSVQRHQDTWLFGHGKNFKVFFEKTFGKSDTFDYGETRRVYQVEAINGRKLFTPPYNLAIDQKTGKWKANFTPHTTKFVQNTWVSQNQLTQAGTSTSRIIAAPGFSSHKNQQETELSRDEEINESPPYQKGHYQDRTEPTSGLAPR